MALFEIDPQQFEQLDTQISGLNGAINRLAENLSPDDSNLHAAVAELSTNLGKWQAQQLQAIQAGFTGLIAAITGADVAEVQQRINALQTAIKTEADALEQSTKTVEGE